MLHSLNWISGLYCSRVITEFLCILEGISLVSLDMNCIVKRRHKPLMNDNRTYYWGETEREAHFLRFFLIRRNKIPVQWCRPTGHSKTLWSEWSPNDSDRESCFKILLCVNETAGRSKDNDKNHPFYIFLRIVSLCINATHLNFF